MYETNELDECIPIFNDDDWEAIFGTEDEIYDEKKSNQISESDAEKPKQNDGSDSLVKLVPAENRAEMSAVYPQPVACSLTNSIVSVNNSEISSSVHKRQNAVHPAKQTQSTLSSMAVMDLCMKREQKLRREGSTVEANLMAKMIELLQSNECIHVGSLMLGAVKASISKGSHDWETLLLYTKSIYALVDEVRIKSTASDSMEQLETINKTRKKLDKKDQVSEV
uniref:Uncharacterized protein n=1 Tax=Onchocerca volvulus TaxID=6282 RepID=A0A8R1TNN9_ONCVO